MHTDLATGCTPDDWSPEFTAMDLPEPAPPWRADQVAWARILRLARPRHRSKR